MKTTSFIKKLFSKSGYLQNIIDQAQAGETISLEPGTYVEEITITKPITIIGNGTNEEVILNGSFNIKADVTLKNIKITNNSTKKNKFGIYIHKGKTTIENCHFTRINGIAILVENTAMLEAKNIYIENVQVGVQLLNGATCSIEDAMVTSNFLNGILLKNHSKAILNRCEFKEHQYPSIYVGQDSEITVQQSKIHSNRDRGVDIENGRATFIDCELYENVEMQLHAINNSDVLLKNCHIHNSCENTHGIYAVQSNVSIEQCTFHHHYDNPQITVVKSKLMMKSTKLYDSPNTNGIRIMEESQAQIEDCEIFNHGLIQVAIENGSNVVIKNCSIYNSVEPGIDFENATGIIENCDIYDNAGQLCLSESSHVTVNSSRIYNSKSDSYGCFASSNSSLVIHDSEIYDNNPIQIYSDHGQLEIHRTKIFNSNGNGVRLVNESNASITECDFYNNSSIQISVESDSNLSIKNSIVHDAIASGIEFEQAKGLLENCQLYQNGNVQLFVKDSSEVMVKDSHMYNGKQEAYGCYVSNEATLTILDCILHNHEMSQIYGDNVTIQVHRTKIYDGKDQGIRLVNHTQAVINDSEIFGQIENFQVSVEDSSHLVLQHSTIHSSESHAILFDQSKGNIENCHIFENGSRQISINDESDVYVSNTKIENGKEDTNGVVVTSASNVEIVNCTFTKHDLPQLFVDESSTFYITKSKIYEGRDCTGIRIVGGSGVIDDCEISKNGDFPQIAIEDSADVAVQNSQIHSGEGMGIIVNSAKSIISNCDIYNNVHAQLHIEENATVEVTQCRIYDGDTHGIRVASGATADIQYVSIFGHKGENAQVVIKERANPTFKHCKIFDGLGEGFLIFEEGFGVIEDCVIYNHQHANFCIVQHSKPVLRRNRIANGHFGVFAEEASPMIENCIFENNVFEDLLYDEDSEPILIGNEYKIIENKREAVHQASKYEGILGFNPYELEQEQLKLKLIAENKKWMNRINAPSSEKRQVAERALVLISEIEKELLT